MFSFLIGAFNLLLGPASETKCWQYFNCVMKGNLMDVEIGKNSFTITVLNLLIGSASKSNFWQYLNCVIKGNLIDFEIGKNSFSY